MGRYLFMANGWDVIRLRRTTVPAACGCLGTPEGTRTPGPLLRRQLLYPPELQAHIVRPLRGPRENALQRSWGKEAQRSEQALPPWAALRAV